MKDNKVCHVFGHNATPTRPHDIPYSHNQTPRPVYAELMTVHW